MGKGARARKTLHNCSDLCETAAMLRKVLAGWRGLRVRRKPVTRHAQHYIPDVCPHCGESVVIPARFEDDNARVVIFPIQQLDAVYGPGPDLEH